MTAPPPVQSHRRDLLVICGLAALTLAAYWPTLQNGFVDFDDDVYVSRNPFVAQGLTRTSLAYAWTTFDLGNWIPVAWMSFELNAALFGLDPRSFHAVDLGLHILNVLLFYLFLAYTTGAGGRSAAAAALFAVHPLHVESVAWIAERKDTLSTLFLLLALHAYVWHAARPSAARMGAVLLAFTLGLLSKPMLMTFPLLLLLVDIWPLGRGRLPGESPRPDRFPPRSWKALVIEKLPLLALSFAIGVVTLSAQQKKTAVVPLDVGAALERVANALYGSGWYLWKSLAPVGLCVFYPLPYGQPRTALQLAPAALILTLLSIAVLRHARRRPEYFFGWLWFLVALIPVSGLVQVGGQAYADRYAYVPHLGLLVLSIWGAADLLQRAPIELRGLLALTAIGLCVPLTIQQVRYWKNPATLWTHALDVNDANWLAHSKLGELEFAAGRRAEASRHFLRMIELLPINPDQAMHFGGLHVEQGEWDQAEKFYRLGLRIAPEDPDVLLHLGIVCAQQGKTEEAIEFFRQCVAREPRKFPAHRQLAMLYLQTGREADALAECQAIVALRPDDPQARLDLGSLLLKAGRLEEAREPLQLAVRLAPQAVAGRVALASLLERTGDLVGAIRELEIASQLAPEDPSLRERQADLQNRQKSAGGPRP
jgi:tetratricopeptide (TPR) repeat protein